MYLATVLLLTVGLAPVQAEGVRPPSGAAAPAPRPVPSPAPRPAGRAYRLQQPATVQFSVETNVGLIEGTLDVTDVVGRGLEGWGAFELVLRLDPTTVRTGDRLRDRVISQQVLLAKKGPLVVATTAYLAPPRAAAPDAPAGEVQPTLPAAVGTLDSTRGRKPVELRYAWKGDAEQGTLAIEHSATLEQLGLSPPPHPFVQLEGPVRLRLAAPLVRER